MKDFNDLLNSGISDELLAAYIDGNTTESENALIENSLNGDSMLSEAYEIANDTVSLEHESAWKLYENYIDNNNLNYIMMDNIFNGGSRIFGEEGQNIKDPIFIQQPDDHSCALRSQQIVLRDFGIDIPFEDLEKIALEAGVYTEQGTYTCDIGKVLEIAGVGMHQVPGSTIYDLTNELAQGHRVIVSVDADELWYNDSVMGKMTNWFNDVFGEQGGNHALIVAGVEVNPDDPNDVKVVLTDPGAGDLRIEYPLDQFMDAWQDSNCFMAATDAAAPYQYDPATGMEVPSNFYTQFSYNQFIANNSYQLNPDLINVPSGYQAAYNGHLESLGDVSYNDFQEDYGKLTSARVNEAISQSGMGSAVNSLIGDLKGLFGHNNASVDGDSGTNETTDQPDDEHYYNDQGHDDASHYETSPDDFEHDNHSANYDDYNVSDDSSLYHN